MYKQSKKILRKFKDIKKKMAGLVTHQIRLSSANQTVRVANDCRARLMYYCEVLTGVLEIDKNDTVNKFCDFKNYENISTIAEKKFLLNLATLLSPMLLNNKCMFNSEEINAENKIYNLSAVRNVFAFSNNVIINGKTTQVKSILLYKNSWLQRNYFEAYAELNREIELQNMFAGALLAALTQDSDSDDENDNNCIIS